MTSLEKTVYLAATDPAFRAKLAAADPQALADLTQEEQAALLDLCQLLALPPHQLLARLRTADAAPLGWILGAERRAGG